MRPLSLTLDGFRSYAKAQTFDFRERRLIGVVGPIGSGKSSILDGLAFALYGKTPTVKRNTKSLINQRLDEAKVELWFEVDGEVWRAVRALRRRGQGASVLTRHESADAESDRVEEVVGVDAVTERVESLLGLDFPAFTRSVLLAQNQFAEFLKARPGDRDAVLKGVFGFDRIEVMQAVAKRRRDDAARNLEELERRRQVIEADRRDLDVSREEMKVARARLDELDAAEQPVASAVAAAAAARAAEVETRARIDELEAFATRMPDRRQADELLAAAERAAAARATAEEATGKAVLASDEANEALAKVVAEYGDADALAAATMAAQRAAEKRDVVARLEAKRAESARAFEQLEKEAASAAAANEDAETARNQAVEAVKAARRAEEEAARLRHEAEHTEMAATLRSGLVAGEPCPVCTQPVATLPKGRPAAAVTTATKELTKAQRAVTKAEKDQEKAAAAASASAGKVAAVKARLGAATESLQDAEDEIGTATEDADAADAAVAELVAGDDPATRLAEWRSVLDAAIAERNARRSALEQARADVERVRSDMEATATNLARLATEVATLAGRLGVDVEPAAEPQPLRIALGSLRTAWQEALDSAQSAAKQAAADLERSDTERREILLGLGLGADADFSEVQEAARSALTHLAGKIEVLEKKVARVAELERENEATLARLATFRRLAEDLTPSRFLNYLLDEERLSLSLLGSDLFEMLSGERYRFSDDGKFDVVDLTAAEGVRSADSLSGGETFLASLALALALAEMVSREGGRLDAFMLDEGFGSLDPEHLDLAMRGIERLVADNPDRLVVVVSHVPDLRERCDDLIILDKDPVTGNTKVERS